jgi:hypothetical protein
MIRILLIITIAISLKFNWLKAFRELIDMNSLSINRNVLLFYFLNKKCSIIVNHVLNYGLICYRLQRKLFWHLII